VAPFLPGLQGLPPVSQTARRELAPRFLTKNQPVNGATGYPNIKKV